MTTRDARTETLREHTQRTGENLQSVAGEAGARVRDEAEERAAAFASRQRKLWSDEVATVANAVRAAGDQFERDESVGMARHTRSVAEGLDDFAGELRTREPGEAFDTLQDFARRQPAAFVGASIAAGFFLSRFFKSSADEARRREISREEAERAEALRVRAASGAPPFHKATPATGTPSESTGPTGPVAPTSSVGPVPDEGRPATETPANPADPTKPAPGRSI